MMMPPLRATALLALCVAVFGYDPVPSGSAPQSTVDATANTAPFAPYINYLLARNDANGNGKFDSGAEFTAIFEATNTTTEYTATLGGVSFANMDNDGDGVISKNELTFYTAGAMLATSEPLVVKWADRFQIGLTGIDTTMAASGGMGSENKYVTGASSLLTMSFEISQASKELPIGNRNDLKTQLCNMIGLNNASGTSCDAAFMAVVTKGSAYEPKTPSDSSGRRLQTAAVTSIVFLKAYYSGDGAAKLAAATGKAQLPDQPTTLSLLGPNVSPLTAPKFVAGTPFPAASIEQTFIGGIIAMLVIFGILGCVLGGLQARRKRKEWGMEYSTCCSTGCCSSWSLRGWVLSAWMASLLLFIACFLVHAAMIKVSDSIVCMADEILKTADLKGDAAAAGKAIDMEMINTIKSHASALPVYAILPALLASLYLLFLSLCYARNARTMKCAKFLSLILMLLLVLCMVIYIIFAILAYAVTMDDVQKEIIKVTSVCDTTVPVLRQTLQDSQTFYTEAQTVANIDAADLSSIKAVLDNAGPSFNIFDQLCVCLNQIFFDFGDLFAPAMLCVMFSAYALWVVFSLCYVAKCCCSPTKPGHSLQSTAPA
jgi:hypothetical protein